MGQCREAPGAPLFQYYDDEQQRHDVDSEEVNAYLQASAELPITAKDFRTWGGTLAAAIHLVQRGPTEAKTETQQHISQMVEEVADQLGNTKSVCRHHYIHPVLIDAYREHRLVPVWREYAQESPAPHLAHEEHATLHVLRDLRAGTLS